MATGFLLFSYLSKELRLQIWEAAEPLFPRTLTCRPLPGFHKNHLERKWVVTPCSASTLLHVNKESRELLLPHYTTSLFSPTHVVSPVLVNYEVDIVYIKMKLEVSGPGDMVFKQLFGQNEKEKSAKIRYFAGNEYFWINISERGWSTYQGWKPFELFRGWTGLREVKLVLVEDELHGGMTQLRRFGEDSPQGHQKLLVKERKQNGDHHEWITGTIKKGFDGLKEGNKEVKIGREVACIETYRNWGG